MSMAWPSARSTPTKSASSAKALLNGLSSVIWLPICMSTPATRTPELGGAGIDIAGAADRDAELVLCLAGRDLGVGPRIDVRIDAQRNVGAAAFARRDGGQQVELGFRFDVDAQDAGSTASASSASLLPTPENMIFSRRDAGRSARRNSPPDTTSAPAPSRASVAITAWLEFAFMA